MYNIHIYTVWAIYLWPIFNVLKVNTQTIATTLNGEIVNMHIEHVWSVFIYLLMQFLAFEFWPFDNTGKWVLILGFHLIDLVLIFQNASLFLRCQIAGIYSNSYQLDLCNFWFGWWWPENVIHRSAKYKNCVAPRDFYPCRIFWPKFFQVNFSDPSLFCARFGPKNPAPVKIPGCHTIFAFRRSVLCDTKFGINELIFF